MAGCAEEQLRVKILLDVDRYFQIRASMKDESFLLGSIIIAKQMETLLQILLRTKTCFWLDSHCRAGRNLTQSSPRTEAYFLVRSLSSSRWKTESFSRTKACFWLDSHHRVGGNHTTNSSKDRNLLLA